MLISNKWYLRMAAVQINENNRLPQRPAGGSGEKASRATPTIGHTPAMIS